MARALRRYGLRGIAFTYLATILIGPLAVVLLTISFVLLLGIGAIRHYTTRHDRG